MLLGVSNWSGCGRFGRDVPGMTGCSAGAGVAIQDHLLGPRGSGDGCVAGVGLSSLRVDEAGRVVAERAQDPGREDHTEPGQAGDQLSVPVTTQMLGHHLTQGFDLLVEGADDRDLRGRSLIAGELVRA